MQFDGIQIFILIAGLTMFLSGVATFLIFAKYFKLWMKAKMSGVDLPLPIIMMMKIRKSNVERIIDAKIMATQAGLDPIPIHKLEAHDLAGGDSKKVVEAMIIATNADMKVQWEDAFQYDLAGREVLDAIREEASYEE